MKALIFSTLWCLFTLASQGYETLATEQRLNGEMMHRAVAKAQQALQQSSAVCYDGRKEIGYATVVSSDGYLLAKWSELREVKNLVLRVGGQKFDTVEKLQGNAAWDVLLLKIDAVGLQPVDYMASSNAGLGTWVVANGVTTRAKRRPMIGIISAASRKIPLEGGAVLGVELIEKKGTLIVGKIAEKSGAFDAGLREGDRLVSVLGTTLKNRQQLLDLMKDRDAGEKVEVVFHRQGKNQKVEVVLQARTETYEIEKNRNDQMSGEFSERRSGFPRVLQHDIYGSRRTVGGPVMDLDGKCLGMNIARANRAESFAIPAEDLKEIAKKLIEQSQQEKR
jgi:serine protease Do